ncbi:MAG TPA: hypothetical protein VKY26_06150, partial [Actinomycetota bacterium]|nr:hypothetical protein [Actinomycetota bacterium]
VLVFYVASVWHALILGLDIGYYAWVRPTIWLAQIPLLALFIRRLLMPVRKGGRRSPARQASLKIVRFGLIAASSLGIVAILFAVVAGHTGFIKTV